MVQFLMMEKTIYLLLRRLLQMLESKIKTYIFLKARSIYLNVWRVNVENITITGAGMWYTNLQFTVVELNEVVFQVVGQVIQIKMAREFQGIRWGL